MSAKPTSKTEPKLLPQQGSHPGEPDAPTRAATPQRQLSELPRDELEHLAEEYGLEPARFKTRQHLVAALHDRRQMIAAMDRDAMLDVIKWGRRPVPANAGREYLAQEITRIESMRFGGLSQRGLVVLARLRGIPLRGDESVPVLVKKLKRNEGFFKKLNRKRRALLGSVVSKIIGDAESAEDYKFLPPPESTDAAAPGTAAPRPGSIKRDIEESGLVGGIAGRIRKSADVYLNQKLDEIEARIDRKLDDIDRRLAEWRDKEITNRIRILKITLWASVIVAVISLLYAYIMVHFVN